MHSYIIEWLIQILGGLINLILISYYYRKNVFFFNSVVFTMSSLFDYDEMYSIYLLYAITFDVTCDRSLVSASKKTDNHG